MADINTLSFGKKFLLRIVLFFVKIYSFTIRIKISQKDKVLLKNAPGNILFLFWHNRLFLVWRIYFLVNKTFKVYALVSPSKDGAWLSELFSFFNIHTIRGSSKRRGMAALDEMSDVLQKDQCVAITPDGPRGPMYQMKTGASMLIQKNLSNVVILNIKYNKFWTLSTWDNFRLPKPFSTMTIEPIFLPKETFNDMSIDETITFLQKNLNSTI